MLEAGLDFRSGFHLFRPLAFELFDLAEYFRLTRGWLHARPRKGSQWTVLATWYSSTSA